MSVDLGRQPVTDVSPSLHPDAHDVPSLPRRRTIVRPATAGAAVHGAWLFILAVALAGVVGMLYLVQTSTVARLGYDLSQVQREIDAESVRNEELTYQLGYYQSLPTIDSIARDQLKMRSADSIVYLDVPAPVSEDLSVPATPTAAPRSGFRRAFDRLLGHAAVGASGASSP